MRPLAEWSLADRRQLIGVFTDIDDTLTTESAITADALAALAALRAAGLHVIPITGRPIGWSEPFARGDAKKGLLPWPVEALVAENGAVAFCLPDLHKNGLQGKNSLLKPLSKIYQQDELTRAENFGKMQAVVQQVLLTVPGSQCSQDSAGRETDIAIDHSEFTHLSAEGIQQVVALLQNAGMTATVSSIHINGWFGAHNKLDGARWIVQALWGRDLNTERQRWAFVGDSTNDQLMFEHFEHSIGVANVRRFEAALAHKPRFITPSERGAGFAEVAAAILQAHAA
jgi:hydroxymethylpyrimidine pyrophosphatase-like HAD family hydrolase